MAWNSVLLSLRSGALACPCGPPGTFSTVLRSHLLATSVFGLSPDSLYFLLLLQRKASAGFHSRHFYSATIAATAFRALGVGYVTTGKNCYTEDWTRVGVFVANTLGTLTARPPRLHPPPACLAEMSCVSVRRKKRKKGDAFLDATANNVRFTNPF